VIGYSQNTATRKKMATEGNLLKAAKSLGKFSLRIPFGKIRISQD